MSLYREIGLTAKNAAEIMADIVEMIDKKMNDVEIVKALSNKYKGLELCFAALTVGRLIGMSFTLQEPERAKAILSDFSRFISILKEFGRERLVKVIEEEILEETFKEVEKLKDAY